MLKIYFFHLSEGLPELALMLHIHYVSLPPPKDTNQFIVSANARKNTVHLNPEERKSIFVLYICLYIYICKKK